MLFANGSFNYLMKIERTKNATRNIVWGVFEKIVSLLLPFAVRTVMIKFLGPEYLGLSSLFASILSVLSIAELGFSSAITFSMYKPIAEDDTETLCALLNFYKKIYHIVGSIILVVGLALLPFLHNFINGSYPSNISIYALYIIYLFNSVIGYFAFAYKAALISAHQRNDLSSKRGIIVHLFGNVIQILILIIFRNYYAYAFIAPIMTIATNLINAFIATKMFPVIVCRGNISNEIKIGLRKRVLGLLSFKIYNVIFSSVDAIVVSAFLGLIPLAIFNNYQYVQTSIIGFLGILTGSITAGVGNKMVTNSVDDNYTDFKNFTFLNAWLTGWCAICLFCLYQHFIQWWVGEELLFSVDTMVLMVLMFLFSRTTTLTYTYREAAGLWWEDRFRPLVAAVANLVVNILLVRTIGINGVIISTIVCTIFINVPWGTIILFKNYFKKSPFEYFSKILFYVLVTAVCGLVTYLVCELLPTVGFGIMLVKGIICVIIPNILFFAVYHKLKEFEYMKILFMRIIKIKK